MLTHDRLTHSAIPFTKRRSYYKVEPRRPWSIVSALLMVFRVMVGVAIAVMVMTLVIAMIVAFMIAVVVAVVFRMARAWWW